MNKKNYLIIALLSISLISLELVWTRIFSAEFFYTFAFLVLSLAILGLGLGALALRLFQSLNREHMLGLFLILTGLMTLIGPPLVFRIGLDFSQLFTQWFMAIKLVATILLLSSSYFFGGITLAMLFKRSPHDMPRLYMADLFGAGSGVLITVVLMNALGTPITTFLCAFPVLLAAFIASKRLIKIMPLVLAIAMLILPYFSKSLLEVKREEPTQLVCEHWDAMAKIKIYDYGKDYRRILIDNAANTGVNGFDGNWENRPDSLRFGFNIVEYVIQLFDSCSFLSLGAGGGQDVFQALQFRATDIHAVEVLSHLNFLMLDGELADFSGRIYHDPRVTVITEDARTYVRRFKNKFDIIYSFSSNSFAALASGAFALAENYLFTTEAFEDYWNAMSDSGFMIMEHQAYMKRLVSEVMNALAHQGVDDPASHFAVFRLQNMRRDMLFLSKRPLTIDMLREAIGEQSPTDAAYVYLQHPPEDSVKNNIIHQIVQSGWRQVADTAKTIISPCTDDRPFIAQMGLWRNFHLHKIGKIRGFEDWMGFPLTQVIIITVLFVVIVIIIPVNFIPYFLKGDKLKAVPWLYFFSIGMAFMMVEVILIQKYTLFIGPSVYSIITILLTLLMSSAIGSRCSSRLNHHVTFVGIIVCLVFEIFIFRNLTAALSYLEMMPRILATSALIFPLGFFMGMPFPKGAMRVGALID